jgi:hypothetical protein
LLRGISALEKSEFKNGKFVDFKVEDPEFTGNQDLIEYVFRSKELIPALEG